ncbi:hypothetical protein VHA_002154 [Grimontia hollisae CIP 101886]|uniref:Uncharacterized protein n=1 Tax=Grimontia hollisae CIP 101886 TaxID=675812 RepID=D0I9L7_GRIHO|nr:hypothetical protein VHA_002154 [Grimontia hollisae CIP 101886]
MPVSAWKRKARVSFNAFQVHGLRNKLRVPEKIEQKQKDSIA